MGLSWCLYQDVKRSDTKCCNDAKSSLRKATGRRVDRTPKTRGKLWADVMAGPVQLVKLLSYGTSLIMALSAACLDPLIGVRMGSFQSLHCQNKGTLNSTFCPQKGSLSQHCAGNSVSFEDRFGGGHGILVRKSSPLDSERPKPTSFHFLRSVQVLNPCGTSSGAHRKILQTGQHANKPRVSCRVSGSKADKTIRFLPVNSGSQQSHKSLSQSKSNLLRLVDSPKGGNRKQVACRGFGSNSQSCEKGERYALGRVLEKSAEGSGWWDAKAAACPAVVKLEFWQLRHSSEPELRLEEIFALTQTGGQLGSEVRDCSDGSWRMYYYGRGGDLWGQGVKAMVAPPMGWIGVAESSDGITWRKLKGPLPNFAVLGPREESPAAFDSVVVGSSDILVRPGGEFWLYYFGGDLQKAPVGRGVGTILGATAGAHWGRGAEMLVKNLVKMIPVEFTGLHWQVGLAKSQDGLDFERGLHPILPTGVPGEWDALYVGWPKVVPPRDGTDDTWLMTYHSLNPNGIFWAAAATSEDGVTWQKRGQVLGPGGKGAWDELGVGVRHVVRLDGRLAMFYEAVDRNQVHAIGLAWSDDGLRWEKDLQCGPDPGGPILRPRTGQDAWDNKNIGTPHVVAVGDGSYRLYYVGVNDRIQFAIGMAISDGPNFRKWRRYGE